MTSPFKSHHHIAGALLILFSTSFYVTAQREPQVRIEPLPQQMGPPVTARVETKNGEISGRVINENGQPLANAGVWVRPVASREAKDSGTTTNREGAFTITSLEPGWYFVNAWKAAYRPPSTYSGPTVQSNSEQVTLVLVKGGVITGTVTNANGDPVVAVGIQVQMVSDEDGRPARTHPFEQMTDDRGVYRVYGLPAGTFIVAAHGGPNYSTTGVNAFAKDLPTYAPSSSRAAAEKITVRVGEETNGVDIRYRAERGNTISGVVKGARMGEQGFSVTLTSLNEEESQRETHFRHANGEFAFEGVEDGDYHIVANGYWNDRERGQSESKVLQVQGADVGGVELTPAGLASVTGAVVLRKLNAPVPECTDERQPQFTHMTASAWHRATQEAKKKPQFVWRGRDIAVPTPQGKITLRNLAASEYYFNVRFSGQQWYLQSITFAPQTPAGKPTDASRTWTTLKPGDQLSGLTFTLAQGAAFLRGQFTLAEGQKLSGKLSVYLVPAEATQADEALRYFAGPVNSEGNFWLHNVVPGRYWILARPGTEDTRDEVSKIRLPDAVGTRSSLRHAAEQRKIEIELKPCQELNFRLPL